MSLLDANIPSPSVSVFDPIEQESWRDSHRKWMNFCYEGITITAPPGVYHPYEDSSTLFFLNNFDIHEAIGDLGGHRFSVLELGCGAGAIGIFIAKKTKVRMTMTDVDITAVEATKGNALINGVSINALCGDVWDPVRDERFDLVLFNLPYWHKEREDSVDLISCDPGGQIFIKFLSGLKRHLLAGGKAVFTYSNLADRRLLIDSAALYGFELFILAEDLNEATGVARWLVEAVPMR